MTDRRMRPIERAQFRRRASDKPAPEPEPDFRFRDTVLTADLDALDATIPAGEATVLGTVDDWDEYAEAFRT